jgi:hypothetical protein
MGDGYVDYYIQHDGKVYNLGYYFEQGFTFWGKPVEIPKEIFNQILSTFKFLD